jgi:hypothetical protein
MAGLGGFGGHFTTQTGVFRPGQAELEAVIRQSEPEPEPREGEQTQLAKGEDEEEDEDEGEEDGHGWECENGCSFRGAFAAVAAHEALCSHQPTPPDGERMDAEEAEEMTCGDVWSVLVWQHAWFEHHGFTSVWWPVKGVRL